MQNNLAQNLYREDRKAQTLSNSKLAAPAAGTNFTSVCSERDCKSEDDGTFSLSVPIFFFLCDRKGQTPQAQKKK